MIEVSFQINPNTDINWINGGFSDGFFRNLLQNLARPSQVIKHQKQRQGKQTRVSLLPILSPVAKISLVGNSLNSMTNQSSEDVELPYRYHQQQTLNQGTENSLPINIGGWRLPS